MSKELILSMTVSADGFVASPNGEIDWAFPAMSDEGRQSVVERLWQVGHIALGHNAYNQMASFWPTADSPVAAPMNQIPKIVFSRQGTITPPAQANSNAGAASDGELGSWQNPIVLGTDLVADVNRLKAEDGKPICAIGGISFASSLIAANLVDLYRLVVHPVALGRGVPFFGALAAPVRFTLEDVKSFKSGVVAKSYRPLPA